ncbi:HAD family phosphatase [Dissulfurirhabdus thermomarina]|uniref:HAD family phosphatase n=1 Tax=Dissulfurirhabdus thermomarina TaxID=1765737 RepID=A0A6N9TMT5_DISTH|nr:HAD family phosphatase [Dissulfurirhabdus thermomarina]NDY41383.1 HAD family phosphatase [Dissulfurirhabdus thermomarina]NMX23601.1 HAD family phosphatase [Dissulfurirhabdus thermomarina]
MNGPPIPPAACSDACGHAGVRAVLFDFGGVLAEEGFREGLRAIARRFGLDPEAFARSAADAVYETGYVTGRGAEADFWAALRGRWGIPGRDSDLSGEILSRFVLRPWMLDWVRAVRRRGLAAVLLSDQTDWLERLDAAAGFGREFDRVFNSYRMGKGKRDASLFDDVAAELGRAPHRLLFVDDDAGNVGRARSRGWHAHLYRDRPGFEAVMRGIGVSLPARG